VPPDTLPGHLVIENLEIRSGRPPFTFTNESGGIEPYVNNAAAIYVEKAEHLVIRNCVLHDSGNGLFIGAFDGATQDVLIERNFIHDNGIESSYYEHNTYTGGTPHHLPVQSRWAGCAPAVRQQPQGPLGRADRPLQLDRGRQPPARPGRRRGQPGAGQPPRLPATFVYGNVLIESDGQGQQPASVHYGGDSGTIDDYRKGTLHFFHNTVVSTRSENTP